MTLLKVLLVVLTVILLNQCTNDLSSPVILEGKLSNYKAEISLVQTGDKLEGEFKYIDLDKPVIHINGVLNNGELVLHEFDDSRNLSGIFQGKFDFKSYDRYWFSPDKKQKVEFEFGKKEEDNKSEEEENLLRLESKELIAYFFDTDNFLDSKKANYREGDSKYIVEFNEIQYLYNKKQALVFFSNYYVDENNNIEDCHACAGFVSIARLERKNDLWRIISFTKDCNCGSGSWGQTHIPTLEKVGETYFLSNSSGYVGQGYYVGGSAYYEIDNFKSVLSSSEEDNSAAVLNEEEVYSYSSNIELGMSNGRIKAIVSYEGTDFNHDKNRIEDITRQEIYFYNEKKKLFIKE